MNKDRLTAYQVLIAHFIETNLKRVAQGQEPLTTQTQGMVDPDSLSIHTVTVSFTGTADPKDGGCCSKF